MMQMYKYAHLCRMFRAAESKRCGAGLHYVRSALRKRAAEVRRGKLDVYHRDPAGVDAIIDGYLRPMQARRGFCKTTL